MNTFSYTMTVIVPVFNVEKYIERCAHSLFNQTFQDIEFIFVNDCTQDNSMVKLEKVIADYPERKVTILNHNVNKGLAGARKTGFEHAHGKYWICCDSDDWIEPNMCERLLSVAEQNDADIVCCGVILETGKQQIMRPYSFSEDSADKILSPHLWGNECGAIWNKLVRADLYKKNNIQPWDGINMWEDSCLTVRLRYFSQKTIILDDCLYHYNTSNSNSITYSFKKEKVLQMVEATKKLEFFFVEQELTSRAMNLVNYLKISSKEVLLRFPSRETLALFRHTFPEATHYIWNYPNWNFILKMRAWLVMVLPFDLAFFVLKHMRK